MNELDAECTHTPYLTDNTRKIENKIAIENDHNKRILNHRNVSQKSQIYNCSNESQKVRSNSKPIIDEFIHRNYKTILEERKSKQEEDLLRPKYMNSETYFIPQISEKSQEMVEEKGQNIHKNNIF